MVIENNNKMIKQKKAAMEMSVGTIVTIVLLMSVLVLGLVLVQNIFSGSQDVVDMTNQQLMEEVSKLFSDEDKVVVYPSSRRKEIKQGEPDGFGIGIKNLLEGTRGNNEFSYEVVVSDPRLEEKCGGVRLAEAEDWMTIGGAERNIPIPVGENSVQKVLFNIPTGSPLCTIRYRINVEADGQNYATDYFDVIIKPSD